MVETKRVTFTCIETNSINFLCIETRINILGHSKCCSTLNEREEKNLGMISDIK